jgi:hypothetical protein
MAVPTDQLNGVIAKIHIRRTQLAAAFGAALSFLHEKRSMRQLR